jgi:acetylornithine deacetylase/succinyl-diaminopimelate desuccinylase-like protein
MEASIDLKTILSEKVNSSDFKEYLSSILIDICRIDNTPGKSIKGLAKRENAVFEKLETAINQLDIPGELKRYPVDYEAISDHKSFTPIFYSDDSHPYQNRYNLVFRPALGKDGDNHKPLTFNAHIDTVPPHIPPEKQGDVITGRGSCDDKGNVVIMLGVLRLIADLHKEYGIEPASEHVFMFVIDEETGGNGTLDLLLKPELKDSCQAAVVLECCGNQAYPANRGALWYKIELPLKNIDNPAIVSARLILALEQEGQKIYRESQHHMFPDRPVQTCHGMLGPWGENPSRICGLVEYTIKSKAGIAELEAVVWQGISKYVDLYGDKTRAEGDKPAVVARHFDLDRSDEGFLLKVYGSAGHMGSLHLHDAAITKAAYIITELCESEHDLEPHLNGMDGRAALIMAGGQGFLPTHNTHGIRERMRNACFGVLRNYGFERGEIDSILTTDRLHNSAFCSDQDMSLFNAVSGYLNMYGLEQDPQVKGWTASCDARLFWDVFPGMPVVTAGAGALKDAHSDDEYISLDEMCKNIAALCHLALKYTG